MRRRANSAIGFPSCFLAVTPSCSPSTYAQFAQWDATDIAVQSLATGERKILIKGGADARYVPTGHLVYMRAGTLMAVPFNLERLEVTGSPVAVIADVMQAAHARTLSDRFGRRAVQRVRVGHVRLRAGRRASSSRTIAALGRSHRRRTPRPRPATRLCGRAALA